MKKKQFMAIFLVLSLIIGLTACSKGPSSNKKGSSSTSGTITLWHTYTGASPYASMFQKEFSNFKQENPDIKFDVEEVNSASDSMGTKITTALAANNVPDMFTYWGGFTITDLVKDKVLMNVQDYLNASKKIKYADIDKAAWAWYTIDGVIHGIPTDGYFPAWFCNKEIFQKYGLQYPKTMDDVKNISAVLNSKGVIPLAVGSKGGNPGHFLVSDLTHQFAGGNDDINNFGKTNKFNTDATLKAAQTISDLQKAHVFPKDTVANGDWTPSFELYNSGMAAMVYSYSFAYGNMSQAMIDKSVIINTPLVDGYKVSSADFVQSSANYGFLVTQKAWGDPTKKSAITKFLDWFLSDDMDQNFYDCGRVSVKTTGAAPKSGIMKEVYDFYKGRTKVPGHFNTTTNTDGWTKLLSETDALFSGSETANQYVQNVQAAYNAGSSKK